MKASSLLLSLLFSLSAFAADELRVELPKTRFVLQLGDLPLGQREGQILPAEDELVRRMLPLITDHKDEQALTLFKTRYKELSELLESGDQRNQIPPTVVAGSSFGQAKPNAVSATLLYVVGTLYSDLKNYMAAQTAYEAVLRVMPDYARVHEALGITYLLQGREKDAQPFLSRALQLGLNTPNIFGALGFLNQRQNNYFGAVAAYQNAMMMEGDNPQWQDGLLYSLTASKQHEAGLALVDQLLAKRQDDPNLWVYRSSLALAAERKQMALDSLEVAIRLGDSAVANLQVCASLHMELGSTERAVALLRAGMSKGLEFAFVDQSMGWLALHEQWAQLQKLLDDSKALGQLNDTQQSRLAQHRAALSKHNNELAQARTQWQQAITLDPSNAEALMAYGLQLHRDKNYAQAELLLQRASSNPVYRENALVTLAQVAIDQQNYQRALQLLEGLYRDNPNRTDLVRNINSLRELLQLQVQ